MRRENKHKSNYESPKKKMKYSPLVTRESTFKQLLDGDSAEFMLFSIFQFYQKEVEQESGPKQLLNNLYFKIENKIIFPFVHLWIRCEDWLKFPLRARKNTIIHIWSTIDPIVLFTCNPYFTDASIHICKLLDRSDSINSILFQPTKLKKIQVRDISEWKIRLNNCGVFNYLKKLTINYEYDPDDDEDTAVLLDLLHILNEKLNLKELCVDYLEYNADEETFSWVPILINSQNLNVVKFLLYARDNHEFFYDEQIIDSISNRAIASKNRNNPLKIIIDIHCDSLCVTTDYFAYNNEKWISAIQAAKDTIHVTIRIQYNVSNDSIFLQHIGKRRIVERVNGQTIEKIIKFYN